MKKKPEANNYTFTWKNADAWTPEKVKEKKASVTEQIEYVKSAIEYHQSAIVCHTKGKKLQEQILETHIKTIKALDMMKFVDKKIVEWKDQEKVR